MKNITVNFGSITITIGDQVISLTKDEAEKLCGELMRTLFDCKPLTAPEPPNPSWPQFWPHRVTCNTTEGADHEQG